MIDLNPPEFSTPRHWTAALPPLRGRLSFGVSLAGITWFGVGGPAEAMFRPADEEDLALCLSHLPDDVPVTVIGVGSNLLVRDGGVAGLVVRLGRGFADISIDGVEVTTGAGALDLNVAMLAGDAGIGGLEFLSGVPGTIGGGLAMNAGAYGGDMSKIVTSASALDPTGTLYHLNNTDFGFHYRGCAVPDDWIFTRAVLTGVEEDPKIVRTRLADIRERRDESQPIRSKTGGSTFRNPEGHKAWELIDRAGCRGLRFGGAQVSEKHCNFLINRARATAAEIEELGEMVRRRVFDDCGILLQWEIRRLGQPLYEDEA
jgi:UDP-N-acetylmuramate dehydrogenase